MGKSAKTKTIRGLTIAEYFRLLRRVRAGELTWSEAEARGYCQAKSKTGPKPIALRVINRKRTK